MGVYPLPRNESQKGRKWRGPRGTVHVWDGTGTIRQEQRPRDGRHGAAKAGQQSRVRVSEHTLTLRTNHKVLCMPSVLIVSCLICKVSLLPVLYMQSVLII